MWLLLSVIISSIVTGVLVWWRYKSKCKSTNHIKIKEYRKSRNVQHDDNIHDTLICVSGTQPNKQEVNLNSSEMPANINRYNSDQLLMDEIDNTLCNIKQNDETIILLPVMEESDEEGEVFNQERNNTQYFSV